MKVGLSACFEEDECQEEEPHAIDGDASPPAQKVGIRVRATVQWQGRSMAHDITMEERLYDWR